MTEILTQKEKELIAVGAAVSASCVKCSNYHFKQAFEQGASKGEINHAVIAVTTVIEDSVEILQRTAYGLMDIERQEITVSDVEISDSLTALIRLAAAVAVNNVINVKKHIEIADELGASSSVIHLTIKLAKAIQKRAGEFADEAIAEALQETDATA